MSDDKEKELPKVREVIGYFVLRLTDSGLAPWLLVAMFLLGALWIAMRQLDSKDALSLILKIGTFHGWVWSGWILAFIEIPIARWVIMRSKRLQENRLMQLEEENLKARALLKKYNADELQLKP